MAKRDKPERGGGIEGFDELTRAQQITYVSDRWKAAGGIDMKRLKKDLMRRSRPTAKERFDAVADKVSSFAKQSWQVIHGAGETLYEYGSEAVRDVQLPDVSEQIQRIRSKLDFEMPKLGSRRNALLAGGAALGAAALAGAGAGLLYGRHLSEEAVQCGESKVAIPLYVYDPDLNGDPIGYIYGGDTGTHKDLMGHDRAIQVSPDALEPGGPLHVWYRALMLLEDSQHDREYYEGFGPALSDYIGINYRMPYTIISGGGGGSSVADQACGALKDGFERPSYYFKKLEDTLCGVGLATSKSPTEIAAYYASFGYLAKGPTGIEGFVRVYWGFDGINDPRMTLGHQLVLAAMHQDTWDSLSFNGDKLKNEFPDERERLLAYNSLYDARWKGEEGIEVRSQKAAKKLIAEGFFEGQDDESVKEALYAQIVAARPPTPRQIAQQPGGFSIKPKHGYKYSTILATEEAKQRFGEAWRERVSSMFLTIDPNVQSAAIHAVRMGLTQTILPQQK